MDEPISAQPTAVTATAATPAETSTGARAGASSARIRAARIWFGGIAVVVGFALIIQIVLIFTGGQDVNAFQSTVGQSLGTRFFHLFSYFTIQSNLFVLGTSIVLALDVWKNGPLWRVLRFDAMLGIIITGIVYEGFLAQLVHPTGWALAATIGFHYISPWATLIGWFLFGPRPRMPWVTTAFAFIWPVAWLVFTFVVGAIMNWYPYPFLDVTLIGFADSLRNCLVILLVGIVIAVILTLLDHRLPALVHDGPRRARRTRPARP